MTRNSLFRKILLLTVFCSLSIISIAQKPLFNIYQTQHWRFPFGEGFDKVLYKGSLDIKDNHLTGLLLAKRTSDTTVRIVFSNEMGMQFFDIEFTGEKSKVHYVFPSMNKKTFISILTEDLKLIFVEDFTIEKFEKTTKEEIIRYSTHSSRGDLLYSVDPESYNIMNIVTSGKKVKKTILNYEYGKKSMPASVSLDNPFIGLKIRMKLLSDE